MLLILGFTSFLFTSCCRCKKLFLTNDEANWVSSFKLGEIQLYQSDLGHIDTLIVTEIRRFHNDCNCVEVSSYQAEFFDAEFIFKSASPNRNNGKCLIVAEKSDTGRWNPSISVLHLSYPATNDSLIPLFVLRKDVDTAFSFEGGRNAITSANQTRLIRNFIWSKNKGLIGYITIDGERFASMKYLENIYPKISSKK